MINISMLTAIFHL
ncbi:hypothetical protein ECPA39_5031, partial [Escherichia coli PA39]